MHRWALSYLSTWKSRKSRKPLVIRGARQVGKSYLVALFGQSDFNQVVEVNLERNPELASLFSLSPYKTIRNLELRFGVSIVPGSTLLFIDEIQTAATVLASLRYFYEELPELHVIAAGSLLEIALEQLSLSMPVGRVEYLHLGPMQFEEFLLAIGKEQLAQFLGELLVDGVIPPAIHSQLLDLLRLFLHIGGMPAVIQAYVDSGSLLECDIVKQSILSTYRDDFGKYGRRVNHQRLTTVYDKLPRLVGSQFKYVQLDRHERAKDLAVALRQLCLARVAFRVRHSSGNGLPLGAEVNERKSKLLFLDVGLMVSSLGLDLIDIEQADDVLLVSQGAVCEQFVGQHLLYSRQLYKEPDLHFWVREERNSTAEVDYIIAVGSEIVPVEVKAGKTGTLKSLQLFLKEKKRSIGLRLNSAPPSLLQAKMSLPGHEQIRFSLVSIPLYMVGQVRRLLSIYRG